MFSQLKNFLSKTLTRRPSETPAPEKTAASAAPTEAPAGKTSGGTAFRAKSRPAPAPAAPAARAAAPVATATATAVATPAVDAGGSDEVLDLPVKVVLNRLPAALSALVKSPGENGNIAVPMQKVLKQLPQGAVKLTFGELRQIAPSGTFLEVATQDQTIVELPLPEIISRLSPAYLQRRAPQKQLEAPPEVANIFGPRGEPLPQPASETAMYRKTGGTTMTAKTAATAPASTAPSLPKPTLPPPPAPAPAPPAPKMPAPAMPKPFTPAPKTEAPKISMPSVPMSAPPAPAPAPAVAAAPAPGAEQTRYFLEKEAAPTSEVLTVALATISETWPEAVKKEIGEQKLGDSSVGLPMHRIEAALKTGKIVFTWGDIGSWIRPNPVAGSANAATVVELPLKVVAPLFISQHRPVTQQKKLAIAENIPDIFAGGTRPGAAPAQAAPAAAAPAPSAAPVAPAPMAPVAPLTPPPPPPLPKPPTPIAPPGLPKPPAAPTPPPAAAPASAPITPTGLPKPPTVPASVPSPSLPRITPPPSPSISMPKPPSAPVLPSLPKPPPMPSMPAPAAAPAPVAAPVAKEPQTLGELFGDPSKKEWSPKEIVQKTNQLKGIAGSMISLPDGLMVAGELPAPFRAETTAAFLPQIFGRMGQYCKELHLGDMNGITVECQKAPLQIIRTGMVFFGVLGRAGEPLPASQIRLIAEELARQNK